MIMSESINRFSTDAFLRKYFLVNVCFSYRKYLYMLRGGRVMWVSSILPFLWWRSNAHSWFYNFLLSDLFVLQYPPSVPAAGCSHIQCSYLFPYLFPYQFCESSFEFTFVLIWASPKDTFTIFMRQGILFTCSDRNILLLLRSLEILRCCFIFDSLKLVRHFGYLKHKIHQLHMSRKCSAESSVSAGMDAFRVSGV